MAERRHWKRGHHANVGVSARLFTSGLRATGRQRDDHSGRLDITGPITEGRVLINAMSGVGAKRKSCARPEHYRLLHPALAERMLIFWRSIRMSMTATIVRVPGSKLNMESTNLNTRLTSIGTRVSGEFRRDARGVAGNYISPSALL